MSNLPSASSNHTETNHKKKHDHSDSHVHNDIHTHDNNNDNQAKALSFAFWLNLIFSIIELVGGILTNSTAIITDALHDFTDAMAIGMAVWLEKISGKPATKNFTYGFKRFSLLSALSMSLFLLVGSAFMIQSAIGALLNPQPVHSLGMLGLAILGVVVNGAAFFNIKNGNTNHTHAHSACHGHANSSDSDSDHNQNSKAIMLHLLEDLLGWVAVLVGALVIYFTNWYWIDGLLTIAIALYVITNALKNIKSCMRILLLATPENIDTEELSAALRAAADNLEITQLKVWSLDGMENIASVHLTVTKKEDISSLKQRLKKILTEYAIDEVNIDIEVA